MKAKNDVAFPCECGGSVRTTPADGQTWELLRDVSVRLPNGTPVPLCDRCGDRFLSPADEARLERLAREAYVPVQAAAAAVLVEKLKRAHGANLKDVERACGVTGTYLSHVIAGRRLASVTLMRALGGFVASPSYFREVCSAWKRFGASTSRQVKKRTLSTVRNQFAAFEAARWPSMGQMQKVTKPLVYSSALIPDGPPSRAGLGS